MSVAVVKLIKVALDNTVIKIHPNPFGTYDISHITVRG